VSDARGRPDPRDGELVDGDGEQDEVGAGHDEHVKHPEAAPVHVVCVWVLVSVSAGHHLETVFVSFLSATAHFFAPKVFSYCTLNCIALIRAGMDSGLLLLL
jgi:hypothetical protein